MNRRSALTLACFLGLAGTTAIVAARVVEPHITGLLLATAALATLAGAAGVARRRAWPLALFLLPLGAYLLIRLQVRLPADAGGLHAQAAFYARQLSAGAATYVRETFPLDATSAALRLVLSLSVYGVVWLAAFLALSMRRALPGVIVLLGLAGFGFTTDEAARTPLPAIAFVALAGGLLALSRAQPRERVRLAHAVAGGLTAMLAALLALSILGVTTVAASRPLGDWRAWNAADPRAMTLHFDWTRNYARLLSEANDAVVMEVRSPVASYWQANVLTGFNGAVWFGALDSGPLEAERNGGSWTYDTPPPAHGDQGRTVTEQFTVENTYTDHLFAGGMPLSLKSTVPLDLLVSSAGSVTVDPAHGPRTSYSVTAFVPDPGPADLLGRGTDYPSDVAATYLQLPFPSRTGYEGPDAARRWQEAVAGQLDGAQWSGLYALDQRIVGTETDPYRIALAIEDYLRHGFRYSLHPKPASDSSPYAAFLFQTRTGYCQHFAGAMALLLRFNGVPARVAVGFKQGTETSDGVYVVRRTDAHAWVEAYFPGVGWAPFDPTPGSELPSVVAAAAAGPAAGAAGSSGSAATAQRSAKIKGPRRALVTDVGGRSAPAAAGTSRGALVWAAVLIGLIGWPAGRALLRRRGLVAGSADDRVRASLGLLYATLRDHGMDPPPSQTLDETARLLRDRLGVDATEVIERVQAVLFGGRTATADDVRDLHGVRRRLGTAVRARSGRLRSLVAAYRPWRTPTSVPGAR